MGLHCFSLRGDKGMDDRMRVVLAEDQAIIRQGLRYIIEAQVDMTVVGEVSDGEQALQKTRETKPDLVLMDIRMPRCDGIEATRAILSELPDVKVVLLTTFDLQEYVIGGIRAGAVGYLLKEAEAPVLLDGMRAAMRGAVVYRSVTAGEALAWVMVDTSVGWYAEQGKLQERLTEREQEILQQMAFGHRNSEIARAVSISEGTVKSHVHSIIQKLGVQDRTQAVVLALRQRLVR
jgi:DNA-binding NarL/FixJ family response regulator